MTATQRRRARRTRQQARELKYASLAVGRAAVVSSATAESGRINSELRDNRVVKQDFSRRGENERGVR